MRIPSLKEIADQNLTHLEGHLAQTSPLNNRAFLRVLAVLLALISVSLYKFGAERSRQNLALTATGDALDQIDPRVTRKLAEYAVLSITIDATSGVVVPITVSFVGDLNGLLYTTNAAVVAADGSALMEITCVESGAAGNLQIGDSLIIVSPVAGVGTVASVTGVVNTGTDDEDEEDYRARVLFDQRATHGGGNATDYRTWAQGVAGVVRAFPYAGKPITSAEDSYPGDRTVYVLADTSIDPDGIPSAGLLTEVRAALNKDPDTGLSRPGLGLVDSTLYVEPVVRTEVAVDITNLSVPAGTEATVRDAIASALTVFFGLYYPYIDGVDLPQERNDKLTTLALSNALQEVFDATGGSAQSVVFKVGGVAYGAYQLAANELLKAGVITYATV